MVERESSLHDGGTLILVTQDDPPGTGSPGNPNGDLSYALDGPDSARIPRDECRSIGGTRSLAAREAYLRALGTRRGLARTDGDR